jgi:dihydrofolate synthase/folylpolyglutamate synthase
MRRVEWPARMQRLSSGRLIGRLPAGSELWLDGGHNVGGAIAIAGAIAELEEKAPRPFVLIAGMLATKDTDGFLACFSGLARCLFALPVAGENTRKPEEIVMAATRAGHAAETAASIEDALEKITALPWEAPPRVLITGSLYLAGEVLAANGTLPN